MSIDCENVSYLPSPRIDARQIDLGDKLNGGRSIGIIISAVDVEAVDTVFMHALVGLS